MSQLRQFICSLHGHDALLHFESARMSLHCTSCEYETEGWDLSPASRGIEVTVPAREYRLPFTPEGRAA